MGVRYKETSRDGASGIIFRAIDLEAIASGQYGHASTIPRNPYVAQTKKTKWSNAL